MQAAGASAAVGSFDGVYCLGDLGGCASQPNGLIEALGEIVGED